MAQSTPSAFQDQPRAMPMRPAGSHDLVYHLQRYAQDNPASAALWCFCIGFVLGWKLKPW